jgi:hypothetical protein
MIRLSDILKEAIFSKAHQPVFLYLGDSQREFLYTPDSSSPTVDTLNSEEKEKYEDDLRKKPLGLIDYINFMKSMIDIDPIYKNMLMKIVKENYKKIEFFLDQLDILKFEDKSNKDLNKLEKFKSFYNKWKDWNPNWAKYNEETYKRVINTINPSLN